MMPVLSKISSGLHTGLDHLSNPRLALDLPQGQGDDVLQVHLQHRGHSVKAGHDHVVRRDAGAVAERNRNRKSTTRPRGLRSSA